MALMVLPPVALLIASALAATPFDACTAARSHGGWTYFCDGIKVVVQDSEGRVLVETDALETTMRLYSDVGRGAPRARERWRLAGTDTEVQKVEISERRSVVYGTAISKREGVRVVICTAQSDPGRCRPMIVELAERAWRSGPEAGANVEPSAPLRLAGRPVIIPEGCQGEVVPSGGHVRCAPSGSAWWFVAVDEASGRVALDGMNTKLIDMYRRANASVARASIPCRLAGVETTCERTRVQPGDPAGVTVLSGGAAVGNEKTFAICIAPGATGAAMPCALVLQPK
jgi:hypothetical protein